MSNQQEKWAEYSCIDAAVAAKVWNAIEPDLKDQGYWDFYRHTMELYPALIFMSSRGLRCDNDALQKTKKDIEEKIERAQALLNEEVGHPLNAQSPKQCQQYFYGELGLKPYTGVKGNVTTDDKAMARIARQGYKAAKYIQEIRGFRKLHGTYLEVVADEDGRIRSQFDPRGTKTGRLSSKQTIFNTGLNFQNIPPEFKTFIIPDENKVFLEIDKAQAEWVVSAYASGDPKMIAAVESGQDIHITTAHYMTNLPIEVLEKEGKIIGKSTDPDFIFQMRQEYMPELLEQGKWLPRYYSCRQMAKRMNHALNYYMGYKRFALEAEIPETEAKTQVELYRGIYCNLRVWWDTIKQTLAKNNRTLVNCWGQKRVFRGAWDHDLLKAAIAHIPQSTVVYILNDGLINTYNNWQDYMYDIDLGAQVHDSILMQYPVKDFRNMAKAVIKCKEYVDPEIHYNGRDFKIGTDLTMGLNWGDYHEKENPKGMNKLPIVDNVTEMADRLEERYGSLTQ